jgi:hypothetical protein
MHDSRFRVIIESESEDIHMGTYLKSSKTVMGKRFNYSGSLAKGVSVDFGDSGNPWFIPAPIIEIIKTEIASRSPVLMGASRRPLVKDSVGETLFREYDFSPAAMTYVLPLLIEDGFCAISTTRPYLISITR